MLVSSNFRKGRIEMAKENNKLKCSRYRAYKVLMNLVSDRPISLLELAAYIKALNSGEFIMQIPFGGAVNGR